MPDVVVVLPGILGSVLERDGKAVWAVRAGAVARALFTLGANIKALELGGDDPDVDELGDGVTATALMDDVHLVPGLWKIDGYGAMTDSVKSTFDVTDGENYFEFPYDWRRDNRVAGRRLRQQSHEWLRSWRERSGNADARLILLAHSMGGLVARSFLELEDGWRDTRSLITFGTPYRGSLNALGFIANGFRKGVGPLTVDLSDLLRSLTSVYQLLPIYPCIDGGDGTLHRAAETDVVPNLVAERAAAALAFHRSIEHAVDEHRRDDTYRRAGYDIFPIVGISQTTAQSARPAGNRMEMLDTIAGRDDGGDGTVPRASATPIEFDDPKRATFSPSPHASVHQTTASLAHVEGVLTADEVPTGAYRAAPKAMSLAVDDVYDSTMPVEVRARAVGQADAIAGTIESTEQPGYTRPLAFSAGDDGWAVGRSSVAPGTYRVTAGIGDEMLASDVTVVM